MGWFKEKKTEREVTAEFVTQMMRSADSLWPDIYATLRDAHGDKFVVEDQAMARFDLGLAWIALHQQAVPNLFSGEQASRILRWIQNLAETPGYEDYSLGELAAYDEAWKRALATEPQALMSSIPGRLVQRWLGPRIRDFTIEISGKRTDYIDAMLLTLVTSLLMGLKPFWKEAKERYRIVLDDFPPDHKFGMR